MIAYVIFVRHFSLCNKNESASAISNYRVFLNSCNRNEPRMKSWIGLPHISAPRKDITQWAVLVFFMGVVSAKRRVWLICNRSVGKDWGRFLNCGREMWCAAYVFVEEDCYFPVEGSIEIICCWAESSRRIAKQPRVFKHYFQVCFRLFFRIG